MAAAQAKRRVRERKVRLVTERRVAQKERLAAKKANTVSNTYDVSQHARKKPRARASGTGADGTYTSAVRVLSAREKALSRELRKVQTALKALRS